MKTIITLILILNSLALTSNDKYEVYFDSQTKKSEMFDKIEEAKLAGIEIKILYSSFTKEDKLSVIQFKAIATNVGEASTTVDFKNKNTCVRFFLDKSPEKKQPAFGVQDCKNQR